MPKPHCFFGLLGQLRDQITWTEFAELEEAANDLMDAVEARTLARAKAVIPALAEALNLAGDDVAAALRAIPV
jgi:hypothetical protein